MRKIMVVAMGIGFLVFAPLSTATSAAAAASPSTVLDPCYGPGGFERQHQHYDFATRLMRNDSPEGVD